jgi:EAL domain-containing protein (putative c-di-GMP-specific phosphodiesterase class I)/CheY-like chemotaxis protein
MTLHSVLVADDDPRVRATLEAVVASDAGLEVVARAADAADAIALAGRYLPDVALVDFRMPGGGPWAAEEIARVSPGTRVLALSAHSDKAAVLEMLRAGVAGYIVKGASAAEVLDAIARLLRGESVLSCEVTADVVHELADQLERRSVGEEIERVRLKRVATALEPGALSVVFQPIVELRGRTPVGFEALARFAIEPIRSPDAWFSEAREAGLGQKLETAALRIALASLSRIPKGCFLSVNIDPDLLGSVDVLEVLEAADLDRVVLELTEHTSVSDYGALELTLQRLRARGLRIAVDDAGAGFSSLRHVLRIAPDVLKIDRSVIQGVVHDPAARALTASLLAFSGQLGIVVVAEGIENEATVTALEALGIEWGQGYALGTPEASHARPLRAARKGAELLTSYASFRRARASGAAGSAASVALSSKTFASKSSSRPSQRRSHVSASSRLGAPNQSRSLTRTNQVPIFSNSIRISSASS